MVLIFLKIIITIVKKKPCYKILSSYHILPSVIMQSIPNEKKKKNKDQMEMSQVQVGKSCISETHVLLNKTENVQ